MTTLDIPALSLVVLIGPSGAGKSTFARRLFKPTEILSSDFLRGVVRDDETNMEGTADAFEVLHLLAKKRLAAGLCTVVDATNVRAEDRAPLVAIARAHHAVPVAIVLDLDVDTCLARNDARPDRPNSRAYVLRQHGSLRRTVGRHGKLLEREGFRVVHVLSSAEEISAAELRRTKVYSDRREERGPFDVIGDVHGCFDELSLLLDQLGYTETSGVRRHPEGRRAIFLGDLVDRGPRSLDCLSLCASMVQAGSALAVPGNHDVKLAKYLRGKKVRVGHGLERTVAELEQLDEETRRIEGERLAGFVEDLVSHLVLDGGKLVVAHAGMKREMQMRASGAVREFALYGETTGEIDEFGLPVRADWAAHYRGDATVVYGHTPVREAEWLNRTICIDTGCVFGGKLTALRYPEGDLVSVPAARTYYEPTKPLAPPREESLSAQQAHDTLLDLGDLLGKRVIHTELVRAVTISSAEAAAALEVLSRFAASPRWLIHVPPTMSPVETSEREGILEHPEEAFAYYGGDGLRELVCEEKHMGSRAIVIVCASEADARERFGVVGEDGIVLTRTGRRFFDDRVIEKGLLDALRAAIEGAGLWDTLGTRWLALDCELLPWSAKAQDLLIRQYAAVGSASQRMLGDASAVLALARANGRAVPELEARTHEREVAARGFVEAYRRYVWPVNGLPDLKLAPFHVLAAEGHVLATRDHGFHLDTIGQLIAADRSGLLLATRTTRVTLGTHESEAAGVRWWEDLVTGGGEGMVVKPLANVVRGKKGLVQPALKVRGPSYLRLIYGPDYDRPEHLARLRKRGVGKKRALATREWALGIEGLKRFVAREPLRRVHECALAVLALESDPVDPRL
jgi:protein phosphatase